ncbi:MAG: Ppx/GppA phosphatase family protein [Alphaproteobacteria bacterium]|nr:Ppx/GppA phosphatase family protein [Alphaproteobacteria bacterium]
MADVTGSTSEAGRQRRQPGARRRPRRAGKKPAPPLYAAVDLGTNNCRLLVARPHGRGFRVVDAFSRIVRLGEGLAERRELSQAAIDRTLSALKVCARKIRRNGVSRARSVATEACRRARNCGDFLTRVERETGLKLEIISAREEADLAFKGCLPLLDGAAREGLVFDIGGGSTELIRLERDGDDHRLLTSVSLPFGVVNLSERFGGRDLAPSAYQTMVASVAEMMAPMTDRVGPQTPGGNGQMQLIGTSGTVTTLAAMHLRLPRYDRTKVDGRYLSFADLAAVRGRLLAMSYEDRVGLACIGRDRADLVLAGCAILDAICQMWPAGRLCVADRGLREGILLGLMRPHCAAVRRARG